MKKSLMAGLTGAFLLGSMGTSFAASNPFTDVPRGHWAYDAVEQLRQDGVIEGYGDGTYRGERTITRYEMAQMIARAMDQFDQQVKGLAGQKPVVQNVGADKAMLDRLAAEFADELNSLGVRVSNLEKYSDKIKWSGKIEYTYTSTRVDENGNGHKSKTNSNGYVFRLEPNAEINDHWSAHARIDVEGDMRDDSIGDATGKRVWAQGDYDNFTIKAGKMELYPNEKGLVLDDDFSGGMVEYKAGDFSLMGFGGRLNVADSKMGDIWADDASAYYAVAQYYYNNNNEDMGDIYTTAGNFITSRVNDKANIWGINAQYSHPTGFEIGAGYYQLDSRLYGLGYDEYGHNIYGLGAFNDAKNKIWSVNAGYNFSDKAKIWGSYARSDVEVAKGWVRDLSSNSKNSWQAELDFGDYADASEKGQWKVYGAYRRYGLFSSIFPTGDGVAWGQKGWEAGVAWAPFKNIGLLAKYFNGEELVNGNDAEKLFGRVEFFF